VCVNAFRNSPKQAVRSRFCCSIVLGSSVCEKSRELSVGARVLSPLSTRIACNPKGHGNDKAHHSLDQIKHRDGVVFQAVLEFVDRHLGLERFGSKLLIATSCMNCIFVSCMLGMILLWNILRLCFWFLLLGLCPMRQVHVLHLDILMLVWGVPFKLRILSISRSNRGRGQLRSRVRNHVLLWCSMHTSRVCVVWYVLIRNHNGVSHIRRKGC